MRLGWRIGVEIELIAPVGRTRRDLALQLAGPGGNVDTFFHAQSEPSLVPGMKAFESLTLGFLARDAAGVEVARCVDDVTLRDRLDAQAPAPPGWYRIVSDDHRLLHLIRRQGPADQGMQAALAPTAALFGTEPMRGPGGMLKVVDEIGSPICIAAPMPGERERACELVTPPIAGDADFAAALESRLRVARGLGFSVPREAAVHLHLEAAQLERADAFANLVELLATWGDALKAWVRTNPACVRLGPIPDRLIEAVRAPDFRSLPWDHARERLAALEPSKYVDFNVKNLAHPRPDKPTFEVRVLPGAITAEPIVTAAGLFVGIAKRALASPVRPEAPRPARDIDRLRHELAAGGFLPGASPNLGDTCGSRG